MSMSAYTPVTSPGFFHSFDSNHKVWTTFNEICVHVDYDEVCVHLDSNEVWVNLDDNAIWWQWKLMWSLVHTKLTSINSHLNLMARSYKTPQVGVQLPEWWGAQPVKKTAACTKYHQVLGQHIRGTQHLRIYYGWTSVTWHFNYWIQICNIKLIKSSNGLNKTFGFTPFPWEAPYTNNQRACISSTSKQKEQVITLLLSGTCLICDVSHQLYQ